MNELIEGFRAAIERWRIERVKNTTRFSMPCP